MPDSLANLLNTSLFCLVIYKKKISEIPLLHFLNQLSSSAQPTIFIYDNSPESQVALAYNNLKIEYVHNSSNPGVSKGYNVAAKFAESSKLEWLFLCDDDIELTEKALNEYAFGIQKDFNLFAPTLLCNEKIYSPCKYFLKKGSHLSISKPGAHQTKGKNFLNNGLLVRTSAFLNTGGYDENIPLYFSDFEFFERFSKSNSEFYWLNCSLNHNLSDETDIDVSRATTRYTYFVLGAKNSAKSPLESIFYFLIVLRRYLKLSARYKSLNFTKPLLSYFKHD